jgi:sodium-dependent phosphate cotransporter
LTAETNDVESLERRVGWKDYASMAISIYFFVSSIEMIKVAAKSLGHGGVDYIVGLIRGPITGVFAGWFGTALVQSSGAFDSIVVALVSAGVIPMITAVGIILGSEVGTTITSLLVSVMGYMRRNIEMFKSTFSIALIHFWYNIGTLVICLLLELSFGVFSNIALMGRDFFSQVPGMALIPSVFDLVSPWVKFVLRYVPGWLGLIGGCALLIFSLSRSERYMTRVFKTDVNRRLLNTAFGSVTKSLLAGFIFTVLVPSTSVMVSLLIPLAAAGIIDSSYNILPYILGANIGTVFDVMIAALATGDPAAIGVWLVHLANNVIGAVVFLPLLRQFSNFVEKTNDFLTVSWKRTVTFVALFHTLPLLLILSAL